MTGTDAPVDSFTASRDAHLALLVAEQHLPQVEFEPSATYVLEHFDGASR